MSGQSGNLYDGVDFEKILTCVHCGLCLEACPTYRELGLEQDSPRGRLYLMRGMWEGVLTPTPEVVAPLSRCLDCRACETACPSKVPYGALLEKTRGALVKNQAPTGLKRLVRQVLLGGLLGSRPWLVRVSWVMRLLSRLGLMRLVARSAVSRWLPAFVAEGARLLPRFEGRSFTTAHAGVWQPTGPLRCTVGLFTGCIMDVADHEIHQATLELLLAAGCRVVIPEEQGCCGALAVHAGERDQPRQLAAVNAAAFAGQAVLVTNAAGCGAQLREYAHLFEGQGDPRWAELASKVRDVLGLLGDLGVAGQSGLWKTEVEAVFYDAPCHLEHAMGAAGPARQFLEGLPGVNLLALRDADRCCGAAGVYNLTQPDLSNQILDRKMAGLKALHEERPEVKLLVTANPGCLFQLRKGCASWGLPLEVVHPAVFVRRRLAVSGAGRRE